MTTNRHSFSILRQRFLAATRAVPAMAAATAVVACGGAGGTEDAASSGVVAAGENANAALLNACEGEAYAPLVGVTPGQPVDYLELRQRWGGGDGSFSTEATEGVACSGASDVDACTEELQSLRPEGWALPYEGMWFNPTRALVHTRGDAVGAVTSLPDLVAFLAPIENVKDAALLANEHGHRIVCGDKVEATDDGFVLETNTGHTCGAHTGIYRHKVRVGADGQVTVLASELVEPGNPYCAIGRRPEGFEAEGIAPSDCPVGDYFAEIAELEAASVFAFRRLAEELRAHGAPEALIEAAQRSARDEIRHTAAMAALARRFGREAAPPQVGEFGVRGLYAIALENAVEGCVRETFGALQATFQADRAAEPAVRRVMAMVATDETRHASLAWAVAAFIEPQLTREERAAIERARQQAVTELAQGLAADTHADVQRLAGAPTREENALLLEQVRAHLWPAAVAA